MPLIIHMPLGVGWDFFRALKVGKPNCQWNTAPYAEVAKAAAAVDNIIMDRAGPMLTPFPYLSP
jgi:hypothetical protein